MTRLIKVLSALGILLSLSSEPSFGAAARPAEEIWQSLEKLPAEREKNLIEGAKSEGEMLWYTNSGVENATRYIQAFKKNYSFINANFWRSKTRQVTQRVVSEAQAGRHLLQSQWAIERDEAYESFSAAC